MSSSSAQASTSTSLPPLFTPTELAQINRDLAGKSPQEILTWAIDHIASGDLWQTTAFGLTGLASLAMISNISLAREETHLVPLIFLDTLYHFPSTLDLAQRASEKYLADLHVFKPAGSDGKEKVNAAEFEAEFGEKLWEREEDVYDYLVKVEPSHRAYSQLNVRAVLTGRRRSQGSERAALPVVEIDSTGLIKINPLIEWSFKQVKDFIDAENVPYNALLDIGYKSIGDWHSTAAPTTSASTATHSDDSERAGRWAGNKAKTECGLHKDYSAMKANFELKRAREEALRLKDEQKDLVAAEVSV
ncbi:putative Phosphoadenylyl-sulfate reductase thioredoxin [Mrakia frigida]|uniref:phosphoadenylyl-sulfate reductase (thioredoxin) n=1 Tax=Mrakia frigida TaxID=29902 RepID=UPI003FCC1563